MISISGKKWIEKKINKNQIEKIKQDFNFNDILSKLIVLRNYDITEINNIDNNLEFTNIFVGSLKGQVSINMHGYSDFKRKLNGSSP